MKPVSQRIERRPRTVVWELTNACNLRCLHCEGSAGRRDPEELTTEEALKLCDDLAALGCERCNLSGGEPLLRKDWPLLAKRLDDHDVAVHLVTNGALLDDEALQTAVDAGVTGVALSLDGLQATHDRIRVGPGGRDMRNFQAVVDALKRAVATPMKVGVITHVNGWNLKEMNGLYRLLADIEPDVWQVQLAVPEGRLRELDTPYLITPEQLEEVYAFLLDAMRDGRVVIRVTDTIGYYTELEPIVRVREHEKALPFWTGCYAGCLVMGIESNGDVKGCPSMPRDFVIGNLRREPLAAIWADEERFAYNTRWDPDQATGFCGTCEFKALCRCGCTTMAFAVTGTVYENPYCLYRVRARRGEYRDRRSQP